MLGLRRKQKCSPESEELVDDAARKQRRHYRDINYPYHLSIHSCSSLINSNALSNIFSHRIPVSTGSTKIDGGGMNDENDDEMEEDYNEDENDWDHQRRNHHRLLSFVYRRCRHMVHKERSVLIWLLKSHWPLRCFFILFLLNYFVFYIRYFTMGRPRWLYGSPMDLREVQKCLLSDTGFNNIIEGGKATPPSDAVYWEWHRFGSHHNKTTSASTISLLSHCPRPAQRSRPSRRLLIAQYSSYGKYAELLDLVAPVNAAYAKLWGHDFVVLQGTAMSFPGISPACSSNEKADPRSTFNKIPILERAYHEQQEGEQNEQRRKYDQVLILDTDAMIVDFDTDITSSLLPDRSSSQPSSSSFSSPSSSYLLAAHRVWRYDWANTWDVNAGITLWNLHHPALPNVLQEWKTSCQNHPALVIERNDDQYFLQRTLLRMGWWKRTRDSIVYSLNQGQLAYYEGTVIKHFKRDARSWTTTSLEQRMMRIRETIQQMQCACSSCINSDKSVGAGDGDIHGRSDVKDTRAMLASSACCQYPLTTKFAKRSRGPAVLEQSYD